MLASLVVGLGGTGSWAVTHLKQLLLADHRWYRLGQDLAYVARDEYNEIGDVPVRLRTLDVDRKHRPVISTGVALDSSVEDVSLAGGVGDAIRDIQESSPEESYWPTIQSFLPKDEASQYQIDDAIRFMTEGAGQIRQFGRIAFFLEQLSGGDRLERVVRPLSRLAHGEGLQVFVVASVAGGTGAGLLIDTLAYLQEARRRFAGETQIRTFSFLVLPGAFSGVVEKPQDRELMQANGYATLRELDRLINAHDSFEVEWVKGRPVDLDARVVDTCYLADGSRDLEVEGSQQLEGHAPFESGLPVAIADAIYTHIHPASGGLLTRDYPNLSESLVSGTPARYSSFGTYTVNYAWEPLMQSLSHRAVSDLVDHLLEGGQTASSERVNSFLSTGATGPLGSGDEQQALPPMAAEGLSVLQDPAAMVIPGTHWLASSDAPAPFPSTPTLADHFPGIGRMRTEYSNSQVIEEVAAIIDRFRGATSDVWSGDPNDVSFNGAANYNTAQSAEEFERAVAIASVAIANANGRRGGVSASKSFLQGLLSRVDHFSEQLGEMPKVDMTAARDDAEMAEAEMHDARTIDDAFEQRAFLAARQQLLELELTEETRRRVASLIGRYRASVERMLNEVEGWESALSILKDRAEQKRQRIDSARAEADRSPVRRQVPMPGDDVESQLWWDAYGASEGQLSTGMERALSVLSWGTEKSPEGQREILFQTPTRTGKGERRNMTLEHLIRVTMEPLSGLRERSVWEILELGQQSSDELATELISGSARLAAYDAGGQQQVTDKSHRDWNHVFATWPAEGPGSALAQAVRSQLEERGQSPQPLDTDRSDVPQDHRVMAFSTRHLLALGSFQGVEICKPAYDGRRSAVPSPHVLPEERSAARLEAVSEDLARQGLVSRPISGLGPDLVRACADPLLLKYTAAAVAGGAVAWEVTDRAAGLGSWVVNGDGGRVELGSEPEFAAVLARVAKGRDHSSAAARQELESTGRRIANGDLDVLRSFAKDPETSALEGQVALLLSVAAAQIIA